MSKKRDIIIADIESQASISLSEQDFNDIHSAIGFTMKAYPADDAPKFKKNLKKIDKKLWKFIRQMK